MLASNQRGFSLLEILIAVALLGILSLGVVNITEDAANTKDRTQEVNENNLQIETAMSRIEWDFLQIYSPLYFSSVMNMNPNAQMNTSSSTAMSSPPPGQPPASSQVAASQVNPYLQQYYEQLIQRFERNEHFRAVSREGLPIPRFYAPERDVLEFFTSSNRRKLENQKQSHFGWVRYSLAPQEPTEKEDTNPNIPKSLRSLVRYYSADDPYSDKRLDIGDAEKIKPGVLLRNVEKLEFHYWDYQRRKWETSLRSIQDGESLIRGLKVIVTWYDNFGTKRVTTRIFRTHWPMVTPQDQLVPQANMTGTPGSATVGDQGGGQNNGF
jgi:prepilin-type N-terminal cleavage/methylation domain-containing protein